MNISQNTSGTKTNPLLFICHASEDKDDFVRPLAEMLSGCGVDVWYDELSVLPGDSLREKIDSGLVECDYGIIIVSQVSITKAWVKRELNDLVAREMHGDKALIIPVWYGISLEEVIRFSPHIAEKLAVIAEDGSTQSLASVCQNILRKVAPELSVSALALNFLSKNQNNKNFKTQEIPITHVIDIAIPRVISVSGKNRVIMELVYQTLTYLGVIDHWENPENFYKSLSTEPSPEFELGIWETMSAAFFATLNECSITKKEEIDALWLTILTGLVNNSNCTLDLVIQYKALENLNRLSTYSNQQSVTIIPKEMPRDASLEEDGDRSYKMFYKTTPLAFYDLLQEDINLADELARVGDYKNSEAKYNEAIKAIENLLPDIEDRRLVDILYQLKASAILQNGFSTTMSRAIENLNELHRQASKIYDEYDFLLVFIKGETLQAKYLLGKPGTAWHECYELMNRVIEYGNDQSKYYIIDLLFGLSNSLQEFIESPKGFIVSLSESIGEETDALSIESKKIMASIDILSKAEKKLIRKKLIIRDPVKGGFVAVKPIVD